MAESITYGAYSIPSPLPLVGESDRLMVVGGKYDHKATNINLVGYFTGATLASLHLQKMQMISGFLNEYQDLNVTLDLSSKTFSKCKIESISFSESDLTTLLPYNVSAIAYNDEDFSNYFGIENPQNSWSYSEGENRVIEATHKVSAKGIKVDNNDPLNNARYFVTGELSAGFQNLSVFHGSYNNAFLQSRNEEIDRKTSTYSVTEVYQFSTSDRPFSNSGIVNLSTSINYNKNNELSVSVEGSIKGSIDACITGGLLGTGNFTPAQATDAAINAIQNSLSSFESGSYDFINTGPSSFEYSIDTGSNIVNFSFNFSDTENLDLIDNVLHKYSVSVNCSKDNSLCEIGVEGALSYHGATIISATGLFENNSRFEQVQDAFDNIDPYLIAKQAFVDFTGVATGYRFNSSYLNDQFTNFSIKKDPIENIITYNYSYNNRIDYSSGQLDNLSLTITDKVPLQLSNVQETIAGFSASLISERTLGEYSVALTSNNEQGDMSILKSIASGYCSGKYIINESESIGVDNISYNLSKYY